MLYILTCKLVQLSNSSSHFFSFNFLLSLCFFCCCGFLFYLLCCVWFEFIGRDTVTTYGKVALRTDKCRRIYQTSVSYEMRDTYCYHCASSTCTTRQRQRIFSQRGENCVKNYKKSVNKATKPQYSHSSRCRFVFICRWCLFCLCLGISVSFISWMRINVSATLLYTVKD